MSMCDVSTQCKSVARSAILCEICAHTMHTFNYSVKLFFSSSSSATLSLSCRFFVRIIFCLKPFPFAAVVLYFLEALHSFSWLFLCFIIFFLFFSCSFRTSPITFITCAKIKTRLRRQKTLTERSRERDKLIHMKNEIAYILNIRSYTRSSPSSDRCNAK